MTVYYETDTALNQYLLFHYGEDDDLMPYAWGPKDAKHFPARIVRETVKKNYGLGLDLGCAVGRSSFELTKFCQQVTAVDSSLSFINAAKRMQSELKLKYAIAGEGGTWLHREARLPEGGYPERVDFLCKDALDFLLSSSEFDLVLAANLLCRLPRPRAFLSMLGKIVLPGGLLILATPYSWLEEYTPRSEWIQGGINGLHQALEGDFKLECVFELPFLIREHHRKYQWGVSQISTWFRMI